MTEKKEEMTGKRKNDRQRREPEKICVNPHEKNNQKKICVNLWDSTISIVLYKFCGDL